MLYCSVDASSSERKAKYINDEWQSPANAGVEKLLIDNKPRLGVFAKRSIQVGEEIRYNYGNIDAPWRKNVSKVMSLSFYKKNPLALYFVILLSVKCNVSCNDFKGACVISHFRQENHISKGSWQLGTQILSKYIDFKCFPIDIYIQKQSCTLFSEFTSARTVSAVSAYMVTRAVTVNLPSPFCNVKNMFLF